ncbi:olfactory receptor class A-like protein 4 [Osmerus eperlanus]|uniref:olfactory receptor class A-like protein 4 n=1 Tax=Osmerus eperlanus TaxID=29151 RepID=UPI002E14D4E4
MGLRANVSTFQTTLYIILVLLGIMGNTTVISVIGKSVLKNTGGGRNSDIILINMALSNLMVSLVRNVLLVISDLGLELYSSKVCCQLLMGVWVWLRSANVWSTFYLSAFHFQTLRRLAPSTGHIGLQRGAPKSLLLSLSLIWFLNYIYSIPAHVFSTRGDQNSTETLMLISSTTRPLLGCVWNFHSSFSGLAYVTTSMVIHEIIPIILMAITNLGSLYTLYSHGRASTSTLNAPTKKRVPAEKRAAKVIVALTVLFISSWGTSIISVNYYNYRRSTGNSSMVLLVLARFANTTFIALSPIVLAVGHRGLRLFIKSVLIH